MKWIVALIAVLLPLLPGEIRAQESSSSPGKLQVAQRPKTGRYTITYQYTEPLPEVSPARLAEIPKSHHPRRLLKVEGVLDGKLRCEIRHWNDGLVTECWVVGREVAFELPGEGVIRLLDPGAFIGEYGIPDYFPEFRWISEATLQEGGRYKGREVEHHRRAGESEGTPESEAWIDPESRLPLALRVRGVTSEYRFQSGAPAPLVLPERFDAFLKAERAYRNRPPGSV